MKVYISGPITGIPDYMERFASAQQKLEQEGYETVNPARITFDISERLKHSGRPELTYRECMAVDILRLLKCDALYLLDGWQESAGVFAEMAMADACGIRIIYEAGNSRKTK